MRTLAERNDAFYAAVAVHIRGQAPSFWTQLQDLLGSYARYPGGERRGGSPYMRRPADALLAVERDRDLMYGHCPSCHCEHHLPQRATHEIFYGHYEPDAADFYRWVSPYSERTSHSYPCPSGAKLNWGSDEGHWWFSEDDRTLLKVRNVTTYGVLEFALLAIASLPRWAERLRLWREIHWIAEGPGSTLTDREAMQLCSDEGVLPLLELDVQEAREVLRARRYERRHEVPA